ncbi:MAG TPA: uroporphyrinogen decarboxylase [Vicinamibacteria bacterium]|nr:uroporphyrinogen decarboxylase [Vicinamibacteria bacterium]
MPAAPPRTESPLFLRACAGEPVERTPTWIMRQAGRYLPEYRALRERHDFLASCRNPELACEITLQPVRRLGVDAAILFSDILVPLPGMGVPVDFRPGPVLGRLVRTRADVETLRVADAGEATQFVAEAVRLLRRELPREVPLIGFAGAPFTLATYLVEGGGSRSFAAIKGLLVSDPGTAHALLGKCAETAASSLTAQVRAGAQAAMLFDSWAGILSPDDVSTFVVPYARRVLERVREFAGETFVPAIYYAGDAAGWLETAVETGARVIGVDWRVDLAAARRRLGPRVAVQGNLDPAVLLGPVAEIRRRAERVLRGAWCLEGPLPTTRPGPALGHVFNLGHGILPSTPPEHARALVDAVRELSEKEAP